MRHAFLPLAAAMCALAAGTASANIMFSDVTIESELGPISVFSMGSGPYVDSIWFRFLEGAVGDEYDPLRSGNVTVGYTAQADTGLLLNALDFSAVGAFSGSGLVLAEGVVEDLESPGVIASSSIRITEDLQPPYLANVGFTRPAGRIRVTQSFAFDAQDTDGLDLASLDIVTHRLLQVPVPEPAALVLLVIGLPALARRR
ncbi:MAG: hypothetical protein KKI02_08830 [Planctomycetes bacterium]|nr:hypothetical protein [Planctomycetota bacterium]